MTDQPASRRPLPAHGDAADGPFRYVHALEFPGLLEQLNSTLVVSSYQAGKLALFRARHGRLSLLPRTFEQAMGVAVSRHRLAIGTAYQVWIFENDSNLARTMMPDAKHDACYLPRRSHVTGNIHIHELAWGRRMPRLTGEGRVRLETCGATHGRRDGLTPPASSQGAPDELWLVNTAFSCLCTLDPAYSFVPRWHPPFITEMADEDRCHLNGMAIENGRPRFVTAFAETNGPRAWSADKAFAGCVIDVDSGTTVARDLAMPHSPRLHNGQLFVLDSGTGRLVRIDPRSGYTECVAELPGYTRGLALCDRWAFVGLSKIRETTTFGGVPLAERRDELKCGVWVVDIETGSVVSFLEFEQDVTEIFDVQLLPGVRNPTVIGLQKDTIHGAFVLPQHCWRPTDWTEHDWAKQQAGPSVWRAGLPSTEPKGKAVKPGTVVDLHYLGRNEPTGRGEYPADVYYLTYRSAACGGCLLAAKLFVPVGEAPQSGWTTSVWSHGLGIPATQFRRWPFVGRDWRATRGMHADG